MEGAFARETVVADPGFYWSYIAEVYEGSGARSLLVVNLTIVDYDASTYLVEMAVENESTGSVTYRFLTLDSRFNILYEEWLDEEGNYYIVEYTGEMPLVYHPSRVGEGADLEASAVVYVNGQEYASATISKRIEVTGEANVTFMDRIVPVFVVETVEVVKSGGQVVSSEASVVYVNNDFIMPLGSVSVDTKDSSINRTMTLVDYYIDPDPLAKYPQTGGEPQPPPELFNLTVEVSLTGNYTGVPESTVYLLDEAGEIIAQASAAEGGFAVKLPRGTYTLKVDPAKGQTIDGQGFFEFSTFIVDGEEVRRAQAEINLAQDTYVSIVFTIYKPGEEPVATETPPQQTQETTPPQPVDSATIPPQQTETTDTQTTQTETNDTDLPEGITIGGAKETSPTPSDGNGQAREPTGGGSPPVPSISKEETGTPLALIGAAIAVIAAAGGATYYFLGVRKGLRKTAPSLPPPTEGRPQYPYYPSTQEPQGQSAQQPAPPQYVQQGQAPVPSVPKPKQTPDKKRCASCGSLIPGKARYCPRCGAPQQ